MIIFQIATEGNKQVPNQSLMKAGNSNSRHSYLITTVFHDHISDLKAINKYQIKVSKCLSTLQKGSF